MTPSLRLTCICACLLAFAGCENKAGDESATEESGTSTGDGDGDAGTGDGDGDGDHNEANFGDCGDETVTVLQDLSQIPAGFDQSAADIIAAIEGNFMGEFRWGPSDGGWTVTHADTQSPLSASIMQVGEVRLVEVDLNGMPPMGELGGICNNYLSVDVELGFATDDGVFAETLSTPMWIPGPDSESLPGFYHELDLDNMSGSLSAADFMTDMGDITAVVLSGQLDDVGLMGELGMEVIITDGPDGIAAFGLIADWDAARVP